MNYIDILKEIEQQFIKSITASSISEKNIAKEFVYFMLNTIDKLIDETNEEISKINTERKVLSYNQLLFINNTNKDVIEFLKENYDNIHSLDEYLNKLQDKLEKISGLDKFLFQRFLNNSEFSGHINAFNNEKKSNVEDANE